MKTTFEYLKEWDEPLNEGFVNKLKTAAIILSVILSVLTPFKLSAQDLNKANETAIVRSIDNIDKAAEDKIVKILEEKGLDAIFTLGQLEDIVKVLKKDGMDAALKEIAKMEVETKARLARKKEIQQKLSSLKPELQKAATVAILDIEKQLGLKICIAQTNRTKEYQAALYAQGRESLESVNAKRKAVGLAPITKDENIIVTKTLDSRHIGGNAVDLCPMKNGKSWWPPAGSKIWKQMGEIAEKHGLDWCGGGAGQTWGEGWDEGHFELMGK